MIVKLKSSAPAYPDLSSNQSYFVIGIEADDYRILNDVGKPYLYPASIFQVGNTAIPDDWMKEYGEDGESYAYPPTLNAVGFFEDFFDGEPSAVSVFWQSLNQRLSTAT